jgi:flagellar protein FlaG
MIERIELMRSDSSRVSDFTGSGTQNKPRTEVVESKVENQSVVVKANESEDSSKSSVQDKIAEDLQKIIESKESLSSLQNRSLDFSFQEELGRVVVQVLDKETNEVIRQIPSEEFARVAKKIDELHEHLNSLQGLLFESKT